MKRSGASLQFLQNGWRKRQPRGKLKRAVREAGYIIETHPQSERRGSVEIKDGVSFRRKRVKLYPDSSNKVRSRRRKNSWVQLGSSTYWWLCKVQEWQQPRWSECALTEGWERRVQMFLWRIWLEEEEGNRAGARYRCRFKGELFLKNRRDLKGEEMAVQPRLTSETIAIWEGKMMGSKDQEVWRFA